MVIFHSYVSLPEGRLTVETSSLNGMTSGISTEVGGDVHPLRQFCTPMDVPLSLLPSLFIPRMLSSPGTLLPLVGALRSICFFFLLLLLTHTHTHIYIYIYLIDLPIPGIIGMMIPGLNPRKKPILPISPHY